MKTYKIVMKENRGSRQIDAIAVTCEGTWKNCTEKFDGENDIGFVEIADENAEYLESMLEGDDNVVSYAEV